MINPETKKFYQLVTKWIQLNRKAYLCIKGFQLILCAVMLALSVWLFLAWKDTESDSKLWPVVVMFCFSHGLDFISFTLDVISGCKRWNFVILVRQIVSCIGLAVTVAVFAIMYHLMKNSKKHKIHF